MHGVFQVTLKTLLVALGLLPTFHEDKPVTPEKTRQLESIAVAIRAAAKTPDEAAFLFAWGDAESKFSLRIHAGRCKKHECDRGRARGPWQVHRVASHTAEQWDRMHGVEHVREQTRYAAGMVRWALRQCPQDPIRGAFRVLGGNGCQKALKGEAARVKSYHAVRRFIP
jgi:hypothetical protein